MPSRSLALHVGDARACGLRLAFVLAMALLPGRALAHHANPLLVGGSRTPRRPRAFGAPLAQAPTTPHLTYYGGRVVSSMQVVQVLWGAGSYLANVTSNGSPSMASFFEGVLDSPYVDWLAEYDTSAQSIGRGGFVGKYTITPSTASTLIDDSQIQTELADQILAGHLPAPTTDAGGNVDTYYVIFFPHGITISEGGTSSCASGGFCAYHGTIGNVGGREVYYGVHPDMQVGSGCESGCGSGTPFQNYTAVAAHEMIETITDPEVGIAAFLGPPLSWYDNANGEIGDICNGDQATIVGGDGVTYTVQTEWSNLAGACIVARPCGDGIVEVGEQCDDGNIVSGDGCSSTCRLESGVATATPTPAATPTAATPTPVPTVTATLPPMDRFTCYKAGATSGSTRFAGIANPPGVTLVDALGASTVSVKAPQLLCAPSDVLGADPSAPTHPEHLEGFAIGTVQQSAPATVTLVDQFNPGGIALTVKKASRLLVPATASLSGTPPTPAAFASDHFECHPVTVALGTPRFAPVPDVSLADEFGPMTVVAQKPRLLCNPVDVNGSDPSAPTHVGHLACYQVRQTDAVRFHKVTGIAVNDELGPGTLDARGPSLLCVPALTSP